MDTETTSNSGWFVINKHSTKRKWCVRWWSLCAKRSLRMWEHQRLNRNCCEFIEFAANIAGNNNTLNGLQQQQQPQQPQ